MKPTKDLKIIGPDEKANARLAGSLLYKVREPAIGCAIADWEVWLEQPACRPAQEGRQNQP